MDLAPGPNTTAMTHSPVFDLGRGTHVRISRVGPVETLASGDGLVPLDYRFVQRGRLSRLAVKKRLNRLVVGALVNAMLKHDGDNTAKWERQARRERAWMARHAPVLAGHPAQVESANGAQS